MKSIRTQSLGSKFIAFDEFSRLQETKIEIKPSIYEKIQKIAKMGRAAKVHVGMAKNSTDYKKI